MRNEPNMRIENYRVQTLRKSEPYQNWGDFHYKGLTIISSGFDEAHGFEHVSVSHPTRCPTWHEMQAVKELFWNDEETVVQFHPKKSAYYRHHPYCLHLWKKIGQEYELPPRETL